MLKSLQCRFSDGKIISKVLSHKVLNIQGSCEYANAILLAVEKCIAEDNTEYYSEIDRKNGVSYINLDTFILEFDDSNLRLDVSINKISSAPKVCAVRYISGDNIRLVLGASIDLTEEEQLKLDNSFMSYSDALTLPSWIRLFECMRLFCEKFDLPVPMVFDVENKQVSFDKNRLNDKSALLYIILTEVFRNIKNVSKIILLSDMNIYSDEEISFLISLIAKQNNIKAIIYHHNYNSDNTIGEDKLKV